MSVPAPTQANVPRIRKERERARVMSLEARVTLTMTVGCVTDAILGRPVRDAVEGP